MKFHGSNHASKIWSMIWTMKFCQQIMLQKSEAWNRFLHNYLMVSIPEHLPTRLGTFRKHLGELKTDRTKNRDLINHASDHASDFWSMIWSMIWSMKFHGSAKHEIMLRSMLKKGLAGPGATKTKAGPPSINLQPIRERWLQWLEISTILQICAKTIKRVEQKV